jgi:hypothetical protein
LANVPSLEIKTGEDFCIAIKQLTELKNATGVYK